MGRLDNKVAIVTGGASGIGEATVRRFAAEGAQVVVADVADATELAAEIGATYRRLDVTSEQEWREVIDATVAEHGRLDVLMNNAGIVSNLPITETDLDAFRKVMAVNVDGVLLGSRLAIEAMQKNPGGSSGSIINTASTTSFLGLAFDLAYTTSKHAVVGLTRSAAAYCAQERLGIRVNSLHPGATYTEILKKHVERDPSLFEVFSNMAPIGRMGEPAEVANLALYLASDESSFSNGAQFVVDGGIVNTHPAM